MTVGQYLQRRERMQTQESSIQFSKFVVVIQPLTHVRLFMTPWTAACQAPLSSTICQSWLQLMPIESVMLSNHLMLYHPLLLLPSIFPSIRVISNEWLFPTSGQSIGASASASVLSMNIQGWFPLGLIGLISMQSKDSQESSPTPQFKSITLGTHASLWSNVHICTWLLEKP